MKSINRSHNPTSLFSWLYHQDTAIFQSTSARVGQAQQVSRHVEADAPTGITRLRLVYAQSACEMPITLAIAHVSQPISLAVITRQTGLYCVELCCEAELSANDLQSLNSIDGVEVFALAPDQAILNIPGLLVMDMDSTAIEIECIDELAVMAGVGDVVAELTERAMQGELDFEQSLRARVGQLKGSDASIIQTLCDKLPLMPGLTEMVRELQSYGWRIVVASGGFTPFVAHLKRALNLDGAFANELVIEHGKLAGLVTGHIVDAQFKADIVISCRDKWQIAKGQVLAIGDGANDIPMINIADYGIAYHAKPKLEQIADVAIRQLNLKALPYLLLKK